MWKPNPPINAQFKKDQHQKLGEVGEFIYQIGELEDLRIPAKHVAIDQIISQEFQSKLAYAKDCLLCYRKITGMGRGIAGVQVGIPEEFAIIYREEGLISMINPVITKRSKDLLRYPEMCMSAAPAIAPVIRPAWIEFTYYNEHGKRQVWNTKADTKEGIMYNRVFQHEIDHLHGIINIDLVQSKDIIYESSKTFYQHAKFEKV